MNIFNTLAVVQQTTSMSENLSIIIGIMIVIILMLITATIFGEKNN